VTVAILDEADADRWARGFPTGVSEEEARQFVWGPWEFNTGAARRSAVTGQPGPGRTPAQTAGTGTA
jgi:hypothetical protein